MADVKTLTWQPRAGASILNGYVAKMRGDVARLTKTLGDGSASPIAADGLNGVGKPTSGDGNVATEYKDQHKVLSQYTGDLTTLDTQIVDIANKTAQLTNDTKTKVEGIVGTIQAVLDTVPKSGPSVETAKNGKPVLDKNGNTIPIWTPADQWYWIDKIDAPVVAVESTVDDAYLTMYGQANYVTNPKPLTAGDNPTYTGSYTGSHSYGSQSGGSGVSGLGQATTAQALTGGEKVQAQAIYKYLLTKGFTAAQAAGIVGNMEVESSLNTGSYNSAEGAIGLCQWEGGRRTALEAYAAAHGESVTDYKTQIDYMMTELNGGESGAMSQIKATTTAGAAAAAWDQYYERSSGAARGQRVANANAIATSMAGVTA